MKIYDDGGGWPGPIDDAGAGGSCDEFLPWYLIGKLSLLLILMMSFSINGIGFC